MNKDMSEESFARRVVVASRPVRRRLRSISQHVRVRFGRGRLVSSDYDAIYSSSTEYRKHYRASVYLPVWEEVTSRLDPSARVLDVGCGPGQFAELLWDMGVRSYVGLDFSAEAIRQAEERVPGFRFLVGDALRDDVVASADHDVIVCMEVLEHIDSDLELLGRLAGGRRVLMTVPDFASPGHVRWFSSAQAVLERYGEHVDVDEVVPVELRVGSSTSTIYLVVARTR